MALYLIIIEQEEQRVEILDQFLLELRQIVLPFGWGALLLLIMRLTRSDGHALTVVIILLVS